MTFWTMLLLAYLALMAVAWLIDVAAIVLMGAAAGLLVLWLYRSKRRDPPRG